MYVLGSCHLMPFHVWNAYFMLYHVSVPHLPTILPHCVPKEPLLSLIWMMLKFIILIYAPKFYIEIIEVIPRSKCIYIATTPTTTLLFSLSPPICHLQEKFPGSALSSNPYHLFWSWIWKPEMDWSKWWIQWKCMDVGCVFPYPWWNTKMQILGQLLHGAKQNWKKRKRKRRSMPFLFFFWTSIELDCSFTIIGHGQAAEDSIPTELCSLPWRFSYDDDCNFLQKGGLELCRFFWSPWIPALFLTSTDYATGIWLQEFMIHTGHMHVMWMTWAGYLEKSSLNSMRHQYWRM